MGRSRTLDMAKGIAIILMVIGHCYSSENPILTLIYGFHMPLFFMISGTIYGVKCRDDKFRFNYLKAATKYIIPYFFCEFLYIALVLALNLVGSPQEAAALALERLHRTARLIGCTVTWYLPCILIVEVLFFLLYDFLSGNFSGKRKNWSLMILPIVAYTAALLIPKGGMWILFARALIGLSFFGAGFDLSYPPCGKMQFLTGGGYCLLLFAVYIVLAMKNGMVSLVDMRLGNPFLYVMNGTLGSLVFLASVDLLADRLTNRAIANSFLLTMGKNTLFILGTHMLLIEVTRLLEYKLLDNFLHGLGWAEGIVYGLMICGMELFLIKSAEKCRVRFARRKE